MTVGPLQPPFRRAFDASQTPRDARNALGITGTGGGGGGGIPEAPTDGTIYGRRGSDASWQPSPAGPAGPTGATGPAGATGATGPAGPGVPTGGTSGQVLKKNTATDYDTSWVTLSYQPLDGDLTSLATASSTNAIYYRSAADTWGPITIGSGLTFTSGTLDAPTFTSSAKGEVPASGGGTANFLRADGTWAAPPAGGGGINTIVIQKFTASGTYTPTASMKYAIVECLGGGGGGGSASPTSVGWYVGGGGGSGGYSRARLTAAQIGASQSITIGAAGAGASGNGFNGGDTFMGASLGAALCAARGGEGGVMTSAAALGRAGVGGVITSAVGDVTFAGAPGGSAWYGAGNTAIGPSGAHGGSSAFGGGAAGGAFGAAASASSYGSGGAGAVTNAGATVNGGAGSAGICIITEYI